MRLLHWKFSQMENTFGIVASYQENEGLIRHRQSLKKVY